MKSQFDLQILFRLQIWSQAEQGEYYLSPPQPTRRRDKALFRRHD